MPTPPSLETIRAKRLQAEQKVEDLRDAEIEAALRNKPIDDHAYLSMCRMRSKQRLRTQKVRQHLGRRGYSIKVQVEKLEKSRAEEEHLALLLSNTEQQLDHWENELRLRRKAIYESLG